MQFGHKLLLIILISMGIGGCASRSEPEPQTEESVEVKENLAIIQAQADLAAARDMNAEWMVREESIHQHPITLGRILDHAQLAHQAGNEEEAIRLARLVSKFARLGIEQAKSQINAAPYYPQ